MERDQTRFTDLPKLGKICISSEFFYGLCVGVWSIALNFHLSACGISESSIGGLLCLGYLVTAAVSFFSGRIGDLKGYPFVMAAGAALMGAALLLISVTTYVPLLYLGHGLYCAGLACLMSMEFNLPLSLIREDQRQYGYNLVLVFYFLGSIAGSALCSVFLKLLAGGDNPYRYVLLLCALIYFGLAVFRGSMPRREAAPARSGSQGIGGLLKMRQVRCCLLYGFLTFGLFTFSTGMLNLVLRLWHGMDDAAVSGIFAVNSMAGCLVLIALPWLIRRVSLYRISTAAMALQFLALLIMSAAPAPGFTAMIFVRTISCNILYTSVDSPMLQAMPPQSRGGYAGMRVFANYVGMSAASWASGWLVERRLFMPMYLICAAVGLCQILTYQLLCRNFLCREAGQAKMKEA